jgi:hypothetical protein
MAHDTVTQTINVEPLHGTTVGDFYDRGMLSAYGHQWFVVIALYQYAPRCWPRSAPGSLRRPHAVTHGFPPDHPFECADGRQSAAGRRRHVATTEPPGAHRRSSTGPGPQSRRHQRQEPAPDRWTGASDKPPGAPSASEQWRHKVNCSVQGEHLPPHSRAGYR